MVAKRLSPALGMPFLGLLPILEGAGTGQQLLFQYHRASMTGAEGEGIAEHRALTSPLALGRGYRAALRRLPLSLESSASEINHPRTPGRRKGSTLLEFGR